LAAAGETTNVIALEGGITTGLVSVRVFVRVTDKYEEVEFLNWKKRPASAVEVADGVVMDEKAEFVT
jgi:hypothetical protein